MSSSNIKPDICIHLENSRETPNTDILEIQFSIRSDVFISQAMLIMCKMSLNEGTVPTFIVNSLNIPSNDCDVEIVKKAYNSAWLDLGFLVSSGEFCNKWLLVANTRIFGQKESYLLCPECSGNRLPVVKQTRAAKPL